MLVWVRKLMSNWVARILVSLLVIGFVFWGISNVLTLVGSDTAIARVGSTPIDASGVQAAYQAALSQASQSGQPDLATRQQLAGQALADALRKQIFDRKSSSLAWWCRMRRSVRRSMRSRHSRPTGCLTRPNSPRCCSRIIRRRTSI